MVSYSKIGDSDNCIGIVDSRYPRRILDAFGDVQKVILDSVYKSSEFTITATGTSPVTAGVVSGSFALITTAATEYAGDNMQVVGSQFKLDPGKPCYFGAKITASDATQSDLLVGLCGVDTALTAASTAHAIDVGAGGVFFSKLDGVTAVNFKTYTTATEKNTASASTLDTLAHVYEFYFDGSAVHGYVDGVLIGTFTTNITTEVLTPSICFRAGEAGAKTCRIHWMRAIQVNG